MFFRKPKVVVFILGCQRSGTTICQNVFSHTKHIAVYREGNKDAMTNGWRLRPIDEIQSLIDRQQARVGIFKPINDSQIALQLLANFENSRIIWIFRDFRDTVNSAVHRWGSSQKDMVEWIGKNIANFGNVENAMPEIQSKPSFAVYAENMSPETAAKLVEWTGKPISKHTGAAIMWYLRNQLFFDQHLESNTHALLVNYEKFVNRPNEQISRICDFIEVRHSEKRAENIFSTSIGKDNVPEIDPPVLAACERLYESLISAEEPAPVLQTARS